MQLFYSISILILSILLPTNVFAQNDIKFTHLLTSNGLVQGYIHAMYQDHKGYVWISTFSNLQRYNGYDFTTYSFIPEDSTTISANTIFAMAEDKNNNLWLGSERGLNLYYPETNTFKRYLHNPDDPNSLGFDHIRSIAVTSNNILWLGTYGGGLDRFDPETETFTHYKKITGDTNSLISNLVNDLYLDENEKLWIATEYGGLSCFNEETQNFTNYVYDANNPHSLNSDIITTIAQDKEGIFWIGSWNDGLFRFEEETGKFSQHAFDPNNPGSFPSNTVRKILFDPLDNMWIATHNGLVLFDEYTGKFKPFQNNPDNNTTIISNTLASLLYTKEGILFIGSFGAGISMYDKNHNKFDVYAGNYSDGSLSSNRVWDIFENNDGNLWIATDNGISIFDRENLTYSYLLQNEEPLIKNCRVIYKDALGYYWIGNDLGLIRYTPDLSGYQILNVQNGIYTIAQDHLGDLWFGGWNTGLFKIPANQLQQESIDKHSIVQYLYDPLDSESLSDNIVWKVFEDEQRNLWVCSRLSAQIFDREKESFSLQLENYAAILDITQNDESSFWLATTGFGILNFNKETHEIKSFSVPEGMPNNIGLTLLMDDANHLWVSTEYGLCRFDPITESFKNFDESDGLPSAYLSLGASEKLSTGELAYGSDKGFFIFNPVDLEENTVSPVVELTDFLISQKSVSIEKATAPSDIRFKQPINQIKEISLPYYDDMISFEFTAISFSLTEKISYRYFLEGFDKTWKVTGKDHKATYTNLDPGEYFLHVKAYNSDGYESSNTLRIKLTIIPPYWQTWWFRILMVIVLFNLLYGAYRLRISYLNDQELILSQRVSDRTSELEEINEEVFQQKEELQAQTAYLREVNKSLEKSERELTQSKDHLEAMVNERTEELNIAKEKAEESDRLKSAFLANMSHEIRTPMNAIVGFSSLLADNNYMKDERDFFIDQINTNSEALLILIDDILDFSAMEAKEPVITQENFNINLLIDELHKFWSLKNGNANVEVRMNNTLSNQNFQLYSDQHRVKQIISNFIGNALKFTEQGYVELGLELKENKVVFYVKDTGIGISKENQEAIFERFRKIESDKNKVFRGVGLGMAISKHLAELLNAEIWVESEENFGSTFYLSLPLEYDTTGTKTPDKKETAKTKKYTWEDKKILIAEDEETNFLFLSKALKKTNIKIYWAKNGKETVDFFENGRVFDVVLMDIKMPVMDGYQAIGAIKSIAPKQIVIAQTAYAKAEDREKVFSAGFDDYLAKPILPDNLLRALEKYL
jgi:signal transduction histidine kinase/ligand-binding sensor domain-containing protein/CheY-like chemotaxis protein